MLDNLKSYCLWAIPFTVSDWEDPKSGLDHSDLSKIPFNINHLEYIRFDGEISNSVV
jgi:hypothetical protein